MPSRQSVASTVLTSGGAASRTCVGVGADDRVHGCRSAGGEDAGRAGKPRNTVVAGKQGLRPAQPRALARGEHETDDARGLARCSLCDRLHRTHRA